MVHRLFAGFVLFTVYDLPFSLFYDLHYALCLMRPLRRTTDDRGQVAPFGLNQVKLP